MKKNIFHLLVLIIGQTSIAQNFSFQLNFTDVLGNKDSLVLGYDYTATDTIDTSFGELTIISTPHDTVFDVRVSDVYTNLFSSSSPGTFQSKKQIMKQNSDCQFTTIAIEIFAKHWPITATWNNLLFNDTCREGSVFTSVHPGGWWDVGSPSNLYRTELASYNSITFSSNNSGNLNSPSTNYDSGAYLDANNDTISVFWLKFADSTLLTTSINEHLLTNKIDIYPNPTNEKIHINITKDITLQNATVSIMDISGRLVLSDIALEYNNTIPLNHLPQGVYILNIRLNEKTQLFRKIVIQQ